MSDRWVVPAGEWIAPVRPCAAVQVEDEIMEVLAYGHTTLRVRRVGAIETEIELASPADVAGLRFAHEHEDFPSLGTWVRRGGA